MPLSIEALEEGGITESCGRGRPDVVGWSAEVEQVGREGFLVEIVERLLFGFAALGRAMVEGPAEDPFAQVVPARVGVGEVEVPCLIDIVRSGDGVVDYAGEKEETAIFIYHSQGVVFRPAVLSSEPSGEGEGHAGFIELETFDTRPESVGLFGLFRWWKVVEY